MPGVVSLDPWDALRRELDRARRYGRQLALIQITPRHADTGDPGSDPPRRRRFRRGAADADHSGLDSLRAALRTGDEVWRMHDRTFVMLPEADHACAAALVARLRERVPGQLSACEVRTACFPGDGLTAAALLAELAHAAPGRERFAPNGSERPAAPRETSTPQLTDETWLRRPGRSWRAQP